MGVRVRRARAPLPSQRACLGGASAPPARRGCGAGAGGAALRAPRVPWTPDPPPPTSSFFSFFSFFFLPPALLDASLPSIDSLLCAARCRVCVWVGGPLCVGRGAGGARRAARRLRSAGRARASSSRCVPARAARPPARPPRRRDRPHLELLGHHFAGHRHGVLPRRSWSAGEGVHRGARAVAGWTGDGATSLGTSGRRSGGRVRFARASGARRAVPRWIAPPRAGTGRAEQRQSRTCCERSSPPLPL